MYTEGLQLKVRRLSREDLERLAVNAMFHLRCVSGSRNSFSADWQESARIAGVGFPQRDSAVEVRHRQAAEFLSREDC